MRLAFQASNALRQQLDTFTPVSFLRDVVTLFASSVATEGQWVLLAVVLFTVDTVINTIWTEGERNTLRGSFSVLRTQGVVLFVFALMLLCLTMLGNAFAVLAWVTEFSYLVLSLVLIKSIFTHAPRLNRVVEFGRIVKAEIQARQNLMLSSSLDPDTDTSPTVPLDSDPSGKAYPLPNPDATSRHAEPDNERDQAGN